MTSVASRLLIGAGLSFSFGCFAGETVPTPPGSNCSIVKEATLQLTEISKRYLAPVEIDGHAYLMVIDTGAESTFLNPEIADTLTLPVDNSSAVRMDTAAGELHPQYRRIVPSLKFGTEQWTDLRVLVASGLPPVQSGSPLKPAGVLGANVLSRYDLELDFPARTLTLYTVSGCMGHFVPWTGSYQAYTPESTRKTLMILPAALNGHPVRAELDTGAYRSVVTSAAADAAGVDRVQLLREPALRGSGAGGQQVDTYLHRFSSFRLGEKTFYNTPFVVGDITLDNSEMLLGMDFLRPRRIWISYSSNWVFMQLATQTGESQTDADAGQRATLPQRPFYLPRLAHGFPEGPAPAQPTLPLIAPPAPK